MKRPRSRSDLNVVPPAGQATGSLPGLPRLLTAGNVAALLCTTRAAVYAMTERGQLPGVTRIGRRVLYRVDDLLEWLDQKRAPSPEE